MKRNIKRRRFPIFINFLLFLIFIFAIIGSIAAWINTRIIIKDLSKIKEELGIQDQEEVERHKGRKGTFLENSDDI
ncbi:hypothetical protein QA612_15025 [Evansella sp. AB-P1]|uniref:hypothetical protein n=1 Tax=Evansella sp. AB-P1 TaxID=3037653 RepID=UPI00241D8259|nr:hypothetical protein [Evansella sp. AB-P1]MDG5788783.1 hypothetical protein [Evansella sp. AB-P1]